MAKFPSKEWCDEAVRLTNEDPEANAAGAGWVGDFGAVIEAEPRTLAKAFVVHLEPKNGKIVRVTVLDDRDDLEEIEPAYLATAPYSVWKALLLGSLDPVEAVLKKRIVVRGDLAPLIERMKYKGVADRVFSQIKTEFIDEVK